MICAAEDVGNADPQALVLAVAAARTAREIGMPEARIPLAQATAYIAAAPKSNAAIVAIDRALADVRAGRVREVPVHLRDAHYKGAQRIGAGDGYKYPHSYSGHYIDQDYMPERRDYYQPGDEGFERILKHRLQRRRHG
jgi:putative ATPase